MPLGSPNSTIASPNRADNSVLVITADGVEYLEQNYSTNLQRKRLRAQNA